MTALPNRISERRTEHLLAEILDAQGWDLRRPPQGELLRQQEYKSHPHLLEIFKHSSKHGSGAGLPEAVLVDRAAISPLAVIEAKSGMAELDLAIKEAREYATPCIEAGFSPLAVGLAGTKEDEFDLRVQKWNGTRWVHVTYDGKPITWIPNRTDLERIASLHAASEIRPTIPRPEVLAARADEINRLLRESGIKDEFRPGVVGAIMLGLWNSGGDIRKDQKFILSDINRACEKAFWEAKKSELAKSLRVDEANEKLAVNARRIVSILERLNVTILTAEYDYLGQLYETFFRYTGGNTIGQYFTPRHIASMMADICEVGSSDVVLDPACGTGGFLISAMNRILHERRITRAQMVKIVQKRLIGFDQEPVTAALCVANMILRGDGSTGVHRGDCFTSKNYPVGKATVVLMNPPFPHEDTDVPPERFVERALEGLRLRGKLAVIIPTSLLAKDGKGAWREKILKTNSLIAVLEMPSELFQPFASSTTSVIVLEKGVPHQARRQSVFVRLQYDGLTLKKGVRVPRSDGKNEITSAVDAVLNKKNVPGFSGVAIVSGQDAWAVGAYILSAPPPLDVLKENVDVLLRRLTSFYTRYAPEIVAQRAAIERGELCAKSYREIAGESRLQRATLHPSKPGTIGGAFDILYGMKELHSREGIPSGRSLIISPTEAYNGCYGWLEFEPVSKPPFVTVAQTGSIGEAFVQLEPCAVNDDCLVLLPKKGKGMPQARLVLAAASLLLERWRFNYGRKLTPQRIANFPISITPQLEKWTTERIVKVQKVISVALAAYQDKQSSQKRPGPKPMVVSMHPLTPEQALSAFMQVDPSKVQAAERKAQKKRRGH